ncbi:MAG: hypothetical protein H0W83_15765, partial [Planctomycetes bacterium]|nr:hypothetical protein [Planctomycetota bacterium]
MERLYIGLIVSPTPMRGLSGIRSLRISNGPFDSITTPVKRCPLQSPTPVKSLSVLEFVMSISLPRFAGSVGVVSHVVGFTTLMLSMLLMAPFASAATATYTGGAGDHLASTPGNWSTGLAPTANDDVVIGPSSEAIQWDVSASGTINRLQLESSFTGALTLGRAITVVTNLQILGGSLITGRDLATPITANFLYIAPAATIVVRRSSTLGEGAGQTITVGTLILEGVITADGEGFDHYSGPGRGTYGRGATHGGLGAYAYIEEYGHTYGSMENPTSLGSGGGTPWGVGGAGGGAITINGFLLVLNGGSRISADGATGGDDEGNTAGAGGSITFSANVLSNSGIIRANGGNGAVSGTWHQPGGGGRISVNQVSFLSMGTMEVNGGVGSGIYGGAYTGTKAYAGTIYFDANTRAHLDVVNHLRLGSDDTNGYGFGDVVIHNGGVLEIDGNPNRNGFAQGFGGAATLLVSTLNIEAGGALRADGFGFTFWDGFGSGRYAVGGSYGGEAGASEPNDTYGSITDPRFLGSNASNSSGGFGGGALLVVATTSVVINGTVSANGLDSTTEGGGGGSG